MGMTSMTLACPLPSCQMVVHPAWMATPVLEADPIAFGYYRSSVSSVSKHATLMRFVELCMIFNHLVPQQLQIQC